MQKRTWIGVLVGAVIIVLTCGLLLPRVPNIRDAANRMACQNNLKRLGLAIHNYHATYQRFPHAVWLQENLPVEKRLSWLAALMPYMEREYLYRQMRKESAWDAEEHREALATRLIDLLCPVKFNRRPAVGQNVTHYVGIAGLGADAAALPGDDVKAGFFGYARDLTMDDVKDGTSNTLMVIETALENGPWLAAGWPTVRGLLPDRQPYLGEDGQFGGFHPPRRFLGGRPDLVNALLVDGSIRSLRISMSPKLLEGLATVAGDEEVDPNAF